MRRWAIVPGLLILLMSAPSTAQAGPTLDPHAADCDGVVGIVLAPFENVDPLVPDEFKVVNDAGHAEVFVDTFRCESLTLGQRTNRDVEYGVLGVSIETPSQCQGKCEGGTQFYLISWVTDDPSFTAWLKDGTGLGERVRLVHDLSGERTDMAPGTWAWGFESSAPSPDPFTMSARATEAKAATGSFSVFWHRTDEGLVQLRTAPKTELFGDAVGTITAAGEPESELARMFGNEPTRVFAVGLSVDLTSGSYAKAVLTTDPAGSP